jgi:subtilisin-like proprotein convertase family protein
MRMLIKSVLVFFISIYLLIFFSISRSQSEIKVLVIDGGGETYFCNYVRDIEKEGYLIFAPACGHPEGFNVNNLSYHFISNFNILFLRSARIGGVEWNDDVKKFVEGGGKLVVLSDTENYYSEDNPTNRLAMKWGVKFRGDEVASADTEKHLITKGIKNINLFWDGYISQYPSDAKILARFGSEAAMVLIKDKMGEAIFGPNNGIMDNKMLILNILNYFSNKTGGKVEIVSIECLNCKQDKILLEKNQTNYTTAWFTFRIWLSDYVSGNLSISLKTPYGIIAHYSSLNLSLNNQDYYDFKTQLEVTTYAQGGTLKLETIFGNSKKTKDIQIEICGMENASCCENNKCEQGLFCINGECKGGKVVNVCNEDEIYNPFKNICIKKGIGCYSDNDCKKIYNVENVTCYGSSILLAGRCCLRNEFWNGTHCEEKRLRIVAIPYKIEWGGLGLSKEYVEKLIGGAIKYFPIPENKVKIVVWERVCNPCVGSICIDRLWDLCPIIVGAVDYGDRFVVISKDNLKDECGSGAAGCVKYVGSSTVIVNLLSQATIAHELGHTFGLLDEYCHYRDLFVWKCGEGAYPNPLKKEYGCRVFPLPTCESFEVKFDKVRVGVLEPIRLYFKSLKGNACNISRLAIERKIGDVWVPLFYCLPTDPCYIMFTEHETGNQKIRVRLITPQEKEIISGEFEVVVEGDSKDSKISGSTCEEEKLSVGLESLSDISNILISRKESHLWFRVEKNNDIKYELDGDFEIYDKNCRKIGESKIEIENSGIYNIKVRGQIHVNKIFDSEILRDKYGFCCLDANVYKHTCAGNLPYLENDGINIMAGGSDGFSAPSHFHLEGEMKKWTE